MDYDEQDPGGGPWEDIEYILYAFIAGVVFLCIYLFC